MNAIQLIRQELEAANGWAMGLIMDLQDQPLAQPTSSGGNHALWLLGHLTYSESSLYDMFILGKPNRFEEWGKLFGMRSQPTTNAADYPAFEDILPKLKAVRADVLAHLETLSEDDLDARSQAPEEFGATFSTVAGCYGAMARHMSFHAGQAADVRRSLGRDPLKA